MTPEQEKMLRAIANAEPHHLPPLRDDPLAQRVHHPEIRALAQVVLELMGMAKPPLVYASMLSEEEAEKLKDLKRRPVRFRWPAEEAMREHRQHYESFVERKAREQREQNESWKEMVDRVCALDTPERREALASFAPFKRVPDPLPLPPEEPKEKKAAPDEGEQEGDDGGCFVHSPAQSRVRDELVHYATDALLQVGGLNGMRAKRDATVLVDRILDRLIDAMEDDWPKNELLLVKQGRV